jgi:hypothetical protein
MAAPWSSGIATATSRCTWSCAAPTTIACSGSRKPSPGPDPARLMPRIRLQARATDLTLAGTPRLLSAGPAHRSGAPASSVESNHHPEADMPQAPLWPNRALGGARRRGCREVAPLDFSESVDPGAYYENLLRPALEAVGLPASRPATQDASAIQGVRLHDLRHIFATLRRSSGVHFMQASKWLGHSNSSLTLDVYSDYIPGQHRGARTRYPSRQHPYEPLRPGRSWYRCGGRVASSVPCMTSADG